MDPYIINNLRPEQNGRHFTNDTFHISWMKIIVFQFKFHWSLFLKVQLRISQHWLGKWFGTEQATSCLSAPMMFWFTDACLDFVELIHWMPVTGGNARPYSQLVRPWNLHTVGTSVNIGTSRRMAAHGHTPSAQEQGPAFSWNTSRILQCHAGLNTGSLSLSSWLF